MCLSKNTIKNCIHKYPFSNDDKLFLISAYEIIWNNIDHSRHYCINPGSLCAGILRESGRTQYDVWMPTTKIKVDNYEKIIMLMMNALN